MEESGKIADSWHPGHFGSMVEVSAKFAVERRKDKNSNKKDAQDARTSYK